MSLTANKEGNYGDTVKVSKGTIVIALYELSFKSYFSELRLSLYKQESAVLHLLLRRSQVGKFSQQSLNKNENICDDSKGFFGSN
jgi:hypothetical protein